MEEADKNTVEGAFPSASYGCKGMSLRDYFAAKAMLKMTWDRGEDEINAIDCYKIADAMMKARET